MHVVNGEVVSSGVAQYSQRRGSKKRRLYVVVVVMEVLVLVLEWGQSFLVSTN